MFFSDFKYNNVKNCKVDILKLYLKNDDGSTIEIRKFDSNNLHMLNFEDVCDKLKSVFPQLRDTNFTVSWIDEEDDVIKITSTEELRIALDTSNKMYSRNMNNSLLERSTVKLHVKLNQKDKNLPFFQKETIIHDNIICDGCNNTISGYRYKCMMCDDYDLCSQCETLGLHPEHFMLRMLQPLDWAIHRSFLNHIKTFLRRKNLNYCYGESLCHERNKKKPEENAATNENIVEESPKRNTKLVDLLTVNEPPLFSDNTSVSHNNSTSAVNPLMEDWTILDKTDISPASSVSSNLNESSESNLATAQVTTTATDPVTTTRTTTTVPVTIATITMPTTSATAPVVTPVAPSVSISAVTSATTSATTSTTAAVARKAAALLAQNHVLNQAQIYPVLPKESRIHHPNPRIHNALTTMISMGFSNNGGVLTHLLETENGDINRVIDILEYGKT